MFPVVLPRAVGRLPLAAAAVLAALALAGCGGSDDGAAGPPQPAATHSYVAFQSTDPVAPLTIPARLGVPTAAPATGKYPAVVIAHGSSGVDTRGPFYAEQLNRAGIATLEIDMWSPRGVGRGTTGRPRTVGETLPDAFGGLRLLAADPRIDAQRSGLMGFSSGGVVSMLAATTPYNVRYAPAGLRFAAHAPFYPVCWAYNRVPGYEFASLTGGAPVLIQAGALDGYDDDPDACRKVVATLPAAAQANVSVIVHPDATHAWDRLEPALTTTDPFSHMGRGGTVDFVPDAATAVRSGDETVAFFRRVFGL